VSHDPSENILICGVGAQETHIIIIINLENICVPFFSVFFFSFVTLSLSFKSLGSVRGFFFWKGIKEINNFI